MDKFWSVFAMPIGLALCFGPAVIVWWLTKDKGSGPDCERLSQTASNNEPSHHHPKSSVRAAGLGNQDRSLRGLQTFAIRGVLRWLECEARSFPDRIMNLGVGGSRPGI
jgi:hypothetical protein